MPQSLTMLESCSVIPFDRWLAVVAPEGAPLTVDPKWREPLLNWATVDAELPAELVQLITEHFDSTTTTVTDLSVLDESYATAPWSLAGDDRQHLEMLTEMVARRRMLEVRSDCRPVLPSSSVCRLRAIESLAAERTLMLGDADGLSVVLAASHAVAVAASSPVQERWLAGEKERAGVEIALEPNETYQLAVLEVSDAATTRQRLRQALNMTTPEAHILLSVYPPAEGFIYALLQQAQLEIISYQRDILHRFIPGGFVIDGGGDLVLVRRSSASALDEDIDTTAAIVAAPYTILELESLAADNLDAGAIDRFAALMDSFSPRPAVHRVIQRQVSRDVLWWNDIEGYGFCAELRHDKQHLAVSLFPFEANLELVVQCAAFWTFADSFTRTYAYRTTKTQDGAVM